MKRHALVRLFAAKQGIPTQQRDEWCANLEKELQAHGIGEEISMSDISNFQKALKNLKKV